MGDDDSPSGEEVATDSPVELSSEDGESVDDPSGIEEEESTSGASVVEAACSLVSASGATDDSSPGEEVEETSTVSG